MRLFIAINFSKDICGKLAALREDLRARSQGGRFALDENLHLTLAFLGECDAKQAATAKSVMNAASFEPFAVSIVRVGRFRRDGGDIWWAGLSDDKPLMNLQRELAERLKDCGFTLEMRKYSPHITLGREVITDSAPWKIAPFGETISSIELMRSERINGRQIYTAIFEKRGAAE
ncbi:MAG: RNA 2',3'-cyclic phosphodiesterase [Clostridiales bacterium]|jgi:2'-5' RNA ligase|nr:RNA 2',3'-cyclic phosphodiesterase [Clostridiales bacterium]